MPRKYFRLLKETNHCSPPLRSAGFQLSSRYPEHSKKITQFSFFFFPCNKALDQSPCELQARLELALHFKKMRAAGSAQGDPAAG